MAYTYKNFRTKKQLKEAVAAGQKLRIYNPSGMFPTKENGQETVEGPHYPEPHRWYAAVTMVNGIITKVK
jgi:hypothetical protein